MPSERYLGIDLGTTNSAVSVIEDKNPRILTVTPDTDHKTIPSVVAHLSGTGLQNDIGGGQWFVGRTAESKYDANPQTAVKSIKREMGEDKNVVLDDSKFTPQQISAQILRKLKDSAEEQIGEEFSKAVITIPAYFDNKQRQATISAGEIAGFSQIELVAEPAAAGVAFNHSDGDLFDRLKEDADNIILIFDIGGGTLDVSLIEYDNLSHDVLATSGDTNLGGDDWDREFKEEIARRIEADCGMNPLDTDTYGTGPEVAIEKAVKSAKHELSQVEKTELEIPFVFNPMTDPVSEPYSYTETITRSDFREITSDCLDRINEPVLDVLEGTDKSTNEIREVLLVGGASRMPQIRDRVEDLVGRRAALVNNPEEIVAEGAGVYGGFEGNQLTGITFRDVVPLSIGVEVENGIFEPVIEKNTGIPEDVTKKFTTANRNQTRVNIQVYQGEREIAEENEKLGEFILSGIPPGPAGSVNIDVLFDIDKSGMLTVEASEVMSGVKEQVTIERSDDSLTTEEIQQAKQEADRLSEQDRAERRRRIEINEAKQAIQKSRELINQQGHNLSEELRDSLGKASEELLTTYKRIVGDSQEGSQEKLVQRTEALEEEISQVGIDMYQPQESLQESNDPEHPGDYTGEPEDDNEDDVAAIGSGDS